MPGLCFCCLSNADKVNIVISHFGTLQRLNHVETSEFPQFIAGRILPVVNILEGPVSTKPCVYYEAMIEEIAEKSDENGLIGIPDSEDKNKVWIPVYREIKAADFVLVDPDAPTITLYVPGSIANIQVLATEDTEVNNSNFRRLKSKVTLKTKSLPAHIEDFLKRGKIDPKDSRVERFRYREASFEFGEQIAVLGIVKEVNDEHGTPLKVLEAVKQEVLSEDFFKNKHLSDWDRRSWLDLTETPSIILTDMPKYFQGVKIPDLSTTKSFAQPVNMSNVRSNVMER